jgi:prepilin peptidase CpaA
MTTLSSIAAVPLVALLALATHSDLREQRIPNALSLGGAFVGLLIQLAFLGPVGIIYAVLGWTVCLLCFLPFYALGGMSAGDVKLMAAVGAFVGPAYGLIACACTLVAGAGMGLAYLGWCAFRTRRPQERDVDSTSTQAASPIGAGLRTRFPYAGAIAAGTVVVLLQPSMLSAIVEKGGWA